MSDTWTTIIVLAAATALIRASGPIALGARALPPAVLRVIALLAASILAALVVVQTFAGGDDRLELDARTLGVAAAVPVLWRHPESIVAAVAVAGIVAAGARALL